MIDTPIVWPDEINPTVDRARLARSSRDRQSVAAPLRALLDRHGHHLIERDAELLTLAYGDGITPPPPLSVIADMLDVSAPRISQLRERALRALAWAAQGEP